MAEKKAVSKPAQSSLAKKLAAQADIMKKYGASDFNPEGGRVASTSKEVEFYPTGLEAFDQEVLGVGGLVKGSMVEISGLPSSGKTAVTLFMAAMIQKQDPEAIVKLYDVENAWTDEWGLSMGMDLDRTYLPEFWGAESLSDQVHADIAHKTPPDVIIIDSLAVLQPQQLMEKDVSDFNMNDNFARARFFTIFFNSLRDGFWSKPKNKEGKVPKDAKQVKLGHTPTVLICINHTKASQESIGGGKTITVYKTVGGVSLDFHASMRLGVKRFGYEKTGTITTHQKIKVTADKNKYAPPKRSCELRLDFKGGLEQMAGLDYLALAIDKGMATQTGGWIQSSFVPGGKIQGKDNFNKYAEETPELKTILLG